MKFSMTEQEKDDLLIQVTAWAGFTVCVYMDLIFYYMPVHFCVFRQGPPLW